MEKFISLMNTHSIHALWQLDKGKIFICRFVNYLTGGNEEYELMPTFSYQTKYLRSYIFLETDSRIVLVDFNQYKNNIKLNSNLELINFLRLTSNKEIICIIFNNYAGEPTIIDGIYNIYHNDNNTDDINLILANEAESQSKYDKDRITDYLYSLGNDFHRNYLAEELKAEKIYKYQDV